METIDRIPEPARNGWGSDADRRKRPGVPMEVEPRKVAGAHWDEPEPQSHRERLERDRPPRQTPVFGNMQPTHGVPGALRKKAYAVPEHRAMHWLLLLAADRIEAYGNLLKQNPLLLAAGGVGAVTLLSSLGRRRRAPLRRR
ncbi:MAG: hypothetical protein ACK4N5_02560 [Myxococcales bacterium]